MFIKIAAGTHIGIVGGYGEKEFEIDTEDREVAILKALLLAINEEKGIDRHKGTTRIYFCNNEEKTIFEYKAGEMFPG